MNKKERIKVETIINLYESQFDFRDMKSRSIVSRIEYLEARDVIEKDDNKEDVYWKCLKRMMRHDEFGNNHVIFKKGGLYKQIEESPDIIVDEEGVTHSIFNFIRHDGSINFERL